MKFKDWVINKSKGKILMPGIFEKCYGCGEKIPYDSENYFALPNGIPFCSEKCAVEHIDKHPTACGCKFCGTPQELEDEIKKLEPRYKSIYRLAWKIYALPVAQKILREKKINQWKAGTLR